MVRRGTQGRYEGLLFKDGALEIRRGVVLGYAQRRLEALELCLCGVGKLEFDDCTGMSGRLEGR